MKTVQLNISVHLPHSLTKSVLTEDLTSKWQRGDMKKTYYKSKSKWLGKSISSSKAFSHQPGRCAMPVPSSASLSPFQKTPAIFRLHLPGSSKPCFCHILRDSICVPKSEPQTLGSSSVSAVEHMRGASDKITLWYIYKSTEIDWKCMLGGRNKAGEKVHCHLEVIYKTVLHLETKLRLPKHVNISLWTA